MAEPDDGLELIRQRMERASRRPPPPRRARVAAGADVTVRTPATAAATAGERGASGAPGAVTVAPAPAAPPMPAPAARPAPGAPPTPASGASRAPRRAATTPRRAAPLRLAADLPSVNLAIRVRRPLDDRLADLIHRLRQDGVRTSKVELVEMLLWELDGEPADAVARLARFREWAPRGAGAPLSGG